MDHPLFQAKVKRYFTANQGHNSRKENEENFETELGIFYGSWLCV
jgi:hypothetical protein